MVPFGRPGKRRSSLNTTGKGVVWERQSSRPGCKQTVSPRVSSLGLSSRQPQTPSVRTSLSDNPHIHFSLLKFLPLSPLCKGHGKGLGLNVLDNQKKVLVTALKVCLQEARRATQEFMEMSKKLLMERSLFKDTDGRLMGGKCHVPFPC